MVEYTGYDVIGDIHGHADALVRLLEQMGYREINGVFRHPDRLAVFCGDFIDRGPQIRDVINICRSMCLGDSAQAVLGNHELNALAYATPHPLRADTFLRPHTEKNAIQIAETLRQLPGDDFTAALDWFRTLPVSLDFGNLRVVHACWDDEKLNTLSAASNRLGHLTTAFLAAASETGNPVHTAAEVVLKGPEMNLPAGHYITDREGHQRSRTRIRWFASPQEHSVASYSFPAMSNPELERLPVPKSAFHLPYPMNAPPVCVGHYWMTDNRPTLLAPNVACVDYSVARNGLLTAYRHSGETVLTNDHFVFVPSQPDGSK